MRQLTSIHQQIDHKIRIEGSRRSNVLKPGCTKSAEEPILDAHFHLRVGTWDKTVTLTGLPHEK